jgi:peptidoglycan/xylan/chitin deacetylase (PgdA/CDA1 family)
VTEPRPIKVAIHRDLTPDLPEVGYVLRTLLRIAGFPYELRWHDDRDAAGEPADIYYGPLRAAVSARITMSWSGRSFRDAPNLEPVRIYDDGRVPCLDFGGPLGSPGAVGTDGCLVSGDILFSSFWLLSGAREHAYPRDRWDNFDLDGSSFLDNDLGSQPLVSLYGAFLHDFFGRMGYTPLEAPWARTPGATAFALSHDVDYPEMIRWIECLRLLRARGLNGLGSIAGVMRGTNHFWRFDDWLAFARKHNAPSTFYFMARQGSLFQYAAGTPDAFYDVRSPKFRRLLKSLVAAGCEIGLHASFNAYSDVDQLCLEKEIIEDAAQAEITGNRHHYWHLDPIEPHETLRRQAQAGFLYDSSLEFDFYPGFRRGTCHPYRPFHPGKRQEIDIVELSPAWMDDHFDRRLVHNAISDPIAYARRLLEVSRRTAGVTVVNYHVRGMNEDFFPRYGRWLVQFLHDYQDSRLDFVSPAEIASQYTAYEDALTRRSVDRTAGLLVAP